jgi:hypothetical protein
MKTAPPAAHGDSTEIDVPSDLLMAEDGDQGALQKPHVQPAGMEKSQSPTQSNDGRNYTPYTTTSASRKNISPQKGAKSTQPSPSPSTGVPLIFDYARLSAERHERLAADNDTQDFDLPVIKSQPEDSEEEPETPAPPRNPFATRNQSQLLNPSQLFGATQVSSTFKKLSPTSSRPSPDDIQNPRNLLSSNLGISSPLKRRAHISSPIPDVSSSQTFRTSPGAVGSGSVVTRTYDDEDDHDAAVPDLPADDYVTARASQERRARLASHGHGASPDDGSYDDSLQRRRRARRRQQAASQQLAAVNLRKRDRSAEVEVPSTNKRRALSNGMHPAPVPLADDETTDDEIANSQENRPQLDLVAEPAEALFSRVQRKQPDPNTMVSSTASAQGVKVISATPVPATLQTQSSREAIPETSPPAGAAGRIEGAAIAVSSAEEGLLSSKEVLPVNIVSMTTSSNEHVPPVAQADELTSGNDLHPAGDAIEQKDPTSSVTDVAVADGLELRSASPNFDGNSRKKDLSVAVLSSPPALSTRSRRGRQAYQRARQALDTPSSTAPPVPTSTSMLTALASTPILSNGTTPATDISPTEAVATAQLGGNATPSRKTRRARKSETCIDRSGTSSALFTQAHIPRIRQRQRSNSTDELARSSPTGLGFETSMRITRPAGLRSGPSLLRNESRSREHSVTGGSGIFGGMAFAISFQSRKPREPEHNHGERAKIAQELADRISQAGGTILVEGFSELFDSPMSTNTVTSPAKSSQSAAGIKLQPHAREVKFTALIADGHSRKEKYMQALALGLPCLAFRWITTCLDQQEVVDWSPYLLCAGESSYLGGAIRSRTLLPYDAAAAQLSEVIAHRPQLLADHRILVVMRKAAETKKKAYVFLAQVLGATLSRVTTMDEARIKLKEMADAGDPYDWVYVDDSAIKLEQLFQSYAEESKRRKRGSRPGKNELAPKKVRVLSEESVIQSLILGRLIEEDDI